MNINKLLDHLEELDVQLEVENGDELYVYGPDEVLTDELKNEVRKHKPELIKMFCKNAGKDTGAPLRLPVMTPAGPGFLTGILLCRHPQLETGRCMEVEMPDGEMLRLRRDEVTPLS